MFNGIKKILFEWPDPDDVTLKRVNDAYESLIEEFNNMDYPTYLRTKHWVLFKEEALKKANFKCQSCNTSDRILSLYHNNYDKRGRETFDDVIVLCENCYTKFCDKEE